MARESNADRVPPATVPCVARDSNSIPTGRLRRTARLGGLAGSQAARSYAGRAADLTRSEEQRRDAAEKRQLQAAEHILDVLGQMKGAAMKLGQIASFVDTGALPKEAHERLETKLAKLRDSAPRVSFEQMRKVIESDLEQPLEEAFAEFEPEAFAAASIGQVYRARLHDGRRVAVKVQYPGIANAVRADVQNLGLLLRVAKMLAPGMDPKAMAEEIRERLTEELDYEIEAQTHRAFARTWRGHPFVVIPEVVTELSGERVLVTEYMDGMGFDQVKELPDTERDRFGEIVYRFFLGSLYRTRRFSADPHPGNYLLLEDGRVAFIDFGMSKRVTVEQVDVELEVMRAGIEGDSQRLRAALVRMGFFDADDQVVTAERVQEHFEAAAGWYAVDGEFTIDRDYVRQVMIDVGGPQSRFWDVMRRQTVPPDTMFARRMEGLTLAVLGQLRATANWHRIAREWLFDEPPATALGEAEAEFFAVAR
jgi:predicted unusual protein kinase regulating ubiquinone biosynthesis (AarF/ABC1/UbiB family)